MARTGNVVWTMLGATLLIASCAVEKKTDGGNGGNTTSSGTGGTTSSGTGGTTSSGTGGTTSSGTGGTTSSGTGGTTSSGTGGGGTGGAGGGTGGSGGTVIPGCGNDVVEGFELCDGSDLDGEQCTTLGFSGGTLGCSGDCYFWDINQCTLASPVCGNNVAERPEECDGTDLGSAEGYPCILLGFTGGTLGCSSGCTLDLSGCTGGQAGWTCPQQYYDANDGCDCGCGVIDPDCTDATAGSCAYCDDVGSCNGGVACGDPASIINASDNASCGAPTCGNDLAEGGEVCDGTDLRGDDCVSLGYASGTLACTSCALDTSGCTPATCGNGTAEGFEWCDGSDLQGIACADIIYFDGGTLGCDNNCNFDTSGCTAPTCGDDTVTGGEYCDGTDLGVLDGASCADMGFSGGDWSCTGCQYDLTGCTGGTPGWTCPEAYYGDGDCDCGCGIIDSDCADPSVFACDYCNGFGSCAPLSNQDCPGSIDPNDNSQCQ